ncbi:MAG TPA: 1-pyrroline-5-carboxylate dehydrogenase, partial [Candidatus Ozemobacteraceae bacterium]|nr:1-pyrroline-5-carboxylate dehydrogenase [Candidatus Ozemobacteraceae bacterium]
MSNTPIGIPLPTNEPTLRYAPGSTERRHLKQELERQVAQPLEIPLFIDGKTVHTGATVEVRAPHDHRQVL